MATAPDTPPPYGVRDRLEPAVVRVLAPNPSPFTYTGTQSYIVGGEGEVAVIDPGPDDPAHVAALIAAVGDARVIAICCTHSHRDHSPGAAPLARATGAPVIGCAPLSFADDGDGADDGAGGRGGARADAAFDLDYRPDHVLADGERVEGRGFALTALATPGHTSNHLCFALEPGGALFTGDHVMGWSTSVVSPPDGDMTDYLASLQRLLAREDRVYYPAHGPAIANPQALVRATIGHRRLRERQIERLVGEGVATIAELVTRMYAGIDPRLHAAAGRSVLAHLIDLGRQGRVRRADDAGDRWTIAA